MSPHDALAACRQVRRIVAITTDNGNPITIGAIDGAILGGDLPLVRRGVAATIYGGKRSGDRRHRRLGGGWHPRLAADVAKALR
jgi:hypothetical protein